MAVSQPLGLVVALIVQSITSLVVAFYHNWRLTLAILATVPITAFVLSSVSKGYRQAITDQQAGLTLATKQVNHAIKNVVLVKCHNTESTEVQHYVHILDSSDRHFRRQTYIAALQTGFMRIAAALVMILALGFGTYLVHKGGAGPGEILTTFWSAVSASTSFNELLPQMLVLEKGRAAGAALKHLLRQVEKGEAHDDGVKGRTPASMEGDIEFKNVNALNDTKRSWPLEH